MSPTESKPNPNPNDVPESAPKNSQSSPGAENASQPKSASEGDNGLKAHLEAALTERDEFRNKWLRTEAELDNYRKRVQRETDEIRSYQSLPLARELLPGLDNLGRALTAAETSKNVEDLLQGVGMVVKQFEDILTRHSIKPIEALGKPFDPNLHEALQQVPSANHPPMTVVQELEKGYTLHDRVVRPTKVIVSSGPPPKNSQHTPHE